MDSIFEESYQDLQAWRELGYALHTALEALPKDVIEPELPKPSSDNLDEDDFREDLYQALLAGVLKHSEATTKATIHLLRERRWPDVSPEHAYYLQQMLNGCLAFVKQFAVGDRDRHVTIFPFPDMPVSKVFLWLMVEWWLDPGLKAYVSMETSAEKIFYRHYNR